MRSRMLAAVIWSACLVTAAYGQEADSTQRSLDWIGGHCLPISDGYGDAPGIQRHCKVNESGRVGVVGQTEVFYATYQRLVAWPELELSLADTAGTAFNAGPYNNTAVAVFHGIPGDSLVRPVWAEMNDGWLGVSWYEPPRLLTTPAGIVMLIPLRFSGTGSLNDDRYFLWLESAWQRLDTSSWSKELSRRLPADHGVWKGVVLDLENMRAESPVWRTDRDGNCCPTGGHVTVEFRLDGDRLVIDRAEHVPAGLDANP